jgi:hypothetical protein
VKLNRDLFPVLTLIDLAADACCEFTCHSSFTFLSWYGRLLRDFAGSGTMAYYLAISVDASTSLPVTPLGVALVIEVSLTCDIESSEYLNNAHC